jgi:guanylate kinase
MRGQLFVITAPSGAGKSSLIAAVLREMPELRLSVSYTTRAPRAGEENGREYHFVDDAAFVAMLGRGEFLEAAEVHGFRYGTSQRVIQGTLERGQDLLLEIDWQGAQQVRKLYPEAIGIFVLPPSMAELERRLRTRGLDSEPVIQRRMANAREEVSHASEFDYAIINKDFDAARQDLAAIIRAARARTPLQLARHPDLFKGN